MFIAMSQIGDCQTRLNLSWNGQGIKCRLAYSLLNADSESTGVIIP